MTEYGIEAFERYQQGKARMEFLSLVGAIVLLLSAMVTITDNFANAPIGVIGLAIAYIIIRPCMHYFKGGLQLWRVRRINSEADFVPLTVWMIPNAHQEVPSYEYEQLNKDKALHPIAKKKLHDVLEYHGKLTAYDVVNVQLLDEQLRDK